MGFIVGLQLLLGLELGDFPPILWTFDAHSLWHAGTAPLCLLWYRYVCFNPHVTNGLSHSYHLDDYIFILRGIRSNFLFLFHFSLKFLSANRIAPNGTSCFAASHLGLFCLLMSHKKDARLI